MALIAMVIFGVWAWFSCGMRGKAIAAWTTLALIIVTAPIGQGMILLGTLPGAPFIFLLILNAINLLAYYGIIGPLPGSKDPRDNLKGKSWLQILGMFFLRPRNRWLGLHRFIIK